MIGGLKHVDCKVIILFSGIVIYKTLVSIVHCKYVPDDCIHCVVPSYVAYFISPCLDLHLLLYAMSFHMILSRLKKLKTGIRDSNDPTTGHVVYKSLVESLEKCKTCFDVLYLCTLVFKIPDALITSFFIIQDVKFQADETYATVLIYLNIVFQYLIILIVPAVEASLLDREVDRIKIILHDKLLLESGVPSETVAIKKFLQYIEARPMRFHILTLIPLNSSFPFVILNVYATYLIVTLQLSHLY